jgi:hypothetical protein
MKWWCLIHDLETDKWSLADTANDTPDEDVENYYYDGWVFGADVQAETLEQAMVIAKERTEKFLRNR